MTSDKWRLMSDVCKHYSSSTIYKTNEIFGYIVCFLLQRIKRIIWCIVIRIRKFASCNNIIKEWLGSKTFWFDYLIIMRPINFVHEHLRVLIWNLLHLLTINVLFRFWLITSMTWTFLTFLTFLTKKISQSWILYNATLGGRQARKTPEHISRSARTCALYFFIIQLFRF